MKTALGKQKTNGHLRVQIQHRTVDLVIEKIKAGELYDCDLVVWTWMLKFAWTDGKTTNHCMKSCNMLVKELGFCRSKVHASLKRLEKAGFIVPLYRLQKKKQLRDTDSLKEFLALRKGGWTPLRNNYTIPPHLKAGTFMKKSVPPAVHKT